MTEVQLLERPYINIVNLIWSFDRQTEKMHLLLVKRANEPFRGKWALPETFMRMRESADQAALRLVKEKIGLELSAIHTEQLATFTNPGRTSGQRAISLAYMTFLPEMPRLRAGYGASEVQWFRFGYKDKRYSLISGNLFFLATKAANENQFYQQTHLESKTNLAFDHEWVFKVAATRIRNKLDYKPNILLTLGAKFTLKEARSVYAPFLMVSPQQIDNSNFKKTHGHMFKDVGISTIKQPGRPPRLYSLRMHDTEKN